MSRKVKVRVRVAMGRRGRKRLDTGPAPAAASAPVPAPEKVPRVARVLALAHHWQGLIRSGAVRDQAAPAALPL
jgi:hypothetical protein